jgi:hypothetical protein
VNSQDQHHEHYGPALQKAGDRLVDATPASAFRALIYVAVSDLRHREMARQSVRGSIPQL